MAGSLLTPLASSAVLAAADPAAGIGLIAAFLAGMISFLSPCVLPLVPGYLSAVSGLSVSELEDGDWRRILTPSLIFVSSFSAVFILLGLGATRVGQLMGDNRALLETISGVLIIIMGVLFVASFFFARLSVEWRPEALMDRLSRSGKKQAGDDEGEASRPKTHVARPLLAGAAFAIAWTPCLGPTLGAILSLSMNTTAPRGVLLLMVYSAGLAIPFLLTALAFSRMTSAFAVVKRHYSVIIAFGGLILIATGILMLTGEFFRLNLEVQDWMSRLGLDFWNSV